MKLDHALIVTRDLDGTVQFFREVVGLTEGPRPPFGVAGHWLYSEGRALVHVVLAANSTHEPLCSERIDHIAFRIDSRVEWATLLERLHRTGTDYQVADVPFTQERQLFVRLSSNVTVEFVGSLNLVNDLA
jgi:catechol-2,3-dioxygenase